MQALFTAVLKPMELPTVTALVRWLGCICSLLELVVSSCEQQQLLEAIKPLDFHVPTLMSDEVRVETGSGEWTQDSPSHNLALFLQGALTLATSALDQLLTQVTVITLIKINH